MVIMKQKTKKLKVCQTKLGSRALLLPSSREKKINKKERWIKEPQLFHFVMKFMGANKPKCFTENKYYYMISKRTNIDQVSKQGQLNAILRMPYMPKEYDHLPEP